MTIEQPTSSGPRYRRPDAEGDSSNALECIVHVDSLEFLVGQETDLMVYGSSLFDLSEEEIRNGLLSGRQRVRSSPCV